MSICLCMIVKNESGIIRRCLNSVKGLIDYWVICDTGSTDNTPEIIQEQLSGIPGKLIFHKWVNFGHNRTLAVQSAQGTADYILLLDADMTVNWEGFDKQSLNADAYNVRYTGNLDYAQRLLVSGNLSWRYIGVTHEFIHCDQATKIENIEGFTINHLCDSTNRNNKAWRDIKLLKKGLEEEPENSRYMYYLAQSYRDAGKMATAIKWYEKRVAANGWDQEQWHAQYQIGRCYLDMNQCDKAIDAFLKAYNLRPSRAEPLWQIARHYRLSSNHHVAYMFAQAAKKIPYPKDILFIEPQVYHHDIIDDLAISAYYIGKHREAWDFNTYLLRNGIPEEKLRYWQNREFSRNQIDRRKPTVLIYSYFPGHFRWLATVVNHFERAGEVVKIVIGDDAIELDNIKIVVMWNGEIRQYQPLKKQCREKNIPYYIAEVGWFPQNDYLILDRNGINATSSLMDDDLSWITIDHLSRSNRFSEKYLRGRKHSGKNSYILCPLQVESDTNIMNQSPFKTMQSFIDHVEKKFHEKRVIFKSHPYEEKNYTTNKELVTSGDFLDMAQDAELVYGINSTCLLESVMMGVPTESVGNGLLQRHRGRESHLIAAMVDKQIPLDASDLSRWLVW